MNTDSITPRIYVASLSDYNGGTLHGRWIDANQDSVDIHAEVLEMLAESAEANAEEWAIHDYEGFGSWRLSEWEQFSTVAAVAEKIEEHGEPVLAFIDAYDVDELDDFEDRYRGEWDSFLEYASQLFDDVYHEVAQAAERSPYLTVDYEQFATDLEMDGYTAIRSSTSTTFVFEDNA